MLTNYNNEKQVLQKRARQNIRDGHENVTVQPSISHRAIKTSLESDRKRATYTATFRILIAGEAKSVVQLLMLI
jgi:hypothetical protein